MVTEWLTRNQVLIGAACLAAVLGLAGGVFAAGQSPEDRASTPEVAMSLAEARRAARMMNDIYVAGTLMTHQMYVREAGNAAAITWAKQVIREVRRKGWPDAHIFDTTGRPLNPDNAPMDAFERDAVAALKSGKPAVEKVEANAYRYATPIRVTDETCLSCHVKNRVGDLLGGVSYSVRLVPGKSSAVRAR